MAERRPAVFIGSSSEGLGVAEAIQVNLDHAYEVAIWSQGVFGLGQGTLEALVDKAEEFDFAVLVLTPDDMVQSRRRRQQSPRDNVLLEIGLFAGVLGRKRTFVVFDRTSNIKLPSDIAGVTLAGYQPHSTGNLSASVGACCTQIKTAINALGLRAQYHPGRFTRELFLARYHAGQRDFQWARLTDLDLQRQELDGIDLSHADLEGVRLRKASLRGSKLFQANLRKADLMGSKLDKADLQGVNLWLAILSDAVIEGVNFSGANLRETRLLNTHGTPKDRRLALIDCETCVKSKWTRCDVTAWLDAGAEFVYSSNFDASIARILFKQS